MKTLRTLFVTTLLSFSFIHSAPAQTATTPSYSSEDRFIELDENGSVLKISENTKVSFFTYGSEDIFFAGTLKEMPEAEVNELLKLLQDGIEEKTGFRPTQVPQISASELEDLDEENNLIFFSIIDVEDDEDEGAGDSNYLIIVEPEGCVIFADKVESLRRAIDVFVQKISTEGEVLSGIYSTSGSSLSF